ncbi:hypothetical protein CNMCM8980_005371 [Aspergillus fumigatiaffinis]|nr:hypothetical protein CNMCM8980_005371 [Aspergillus fumigatiaffinis]
MAAMSNPLLIPEIVGLVIDHVQLARDLLNCACVNSIWNMAALYRGSLNDMQFRTPDIGSLNCLLVASRVRFTRNMSYVKHLLLSPEIPTVDDAAGWQTRLACFEKCRAMRRRQYAELLLRPRGRGLASLTIPFELVDQDWCFISDLLLTPTVQYLAIDGFYCGLLTARSWQGKFSNLKALTIYKSDSHQDLDEFCKLLNCCPDLQFFHLEEGRSTFRQDQTDTAEPTTNLLSCLGQHQNLKALALMTPRCWPRLQSVFATLPKTAQRGPWPKLKALYLRNGDPDWWQQLPRFKELQILSLRPTSEVLAINRTAIEEIAKCRRLRVIDLEFDELDDVGALLCIAHGCPLLRKLKVYFDRSEEMSEDLFLGLLRALLVWKFSNLAGKPVWMVQRFKSWHITVRD